MPWGLILRIVGPLALAAVLFGWGYSVGGAGERRKADKALIEATNKARQTETNLRTDLEAVDELREEQLAAAAARHAADLAWVHNRSARLSAAARAACAGSSGAELSREDSEAAVGIGYDAQQVVVELRACEARERSAYEAMKGR